MSAFKKSFLILFLGVIVSLFVFFLQTTFLRSERISVFGAEPTPPAPGERGESVVRSFFSFDTSSPVTWVNSIYRYGIVAISLFAAAGIAYGGIRYLTSGGSPEAITSAKNTIFSAISGLVLMLLSHMILRTLDPRLVKLQLTAPGIELKEFSLDETTLAMLARGGYPPGSGCDQPGSCVFGYACMPSTNDPNSPKICQKVKTEESERFCNTIDDCDAAKDERCYNGKCWAETRCFSHRDCGEGYLCMTDIYKCRKKEFGEKEENAPCTNHNECKSGFCNQGKKKCDKEFGSGEGELCLSNSDCDGRHCLLGKCMGPIRDKANGERCFGHIDCQSGICGREFECREEYYGEEWCLLTDESVCKDPVPDGENCYWNEECQSGYCSHVSDWWGKRTKYKCASLSLRGEEGDGCYWDSDCSSNICIRLYNPDKCAPVGGQKRGEECEYSMQCASHCCVTNSGNWQAAWDTTEEAVGQGGNRSCQAASKCR